MDFYYGRFSGNSARVAFALNEIGATYEKRVLDTRERENQSVDYLSVNPMGKIPALVDGSFKLWESNAINLYLAEKFPGTKLIPPSLEGRASVQRWLFFQAAHVTPACISVFRSTNARVQEFWKSKTDERALESGRKELARYLPVLESALEVHPWLEKSFSLADIAYAPHLFLVAEGGFDFAPYPRIRAWLDRMTSRPAWKKTNEMIFGG